ncbi:MAG: SPOR domain-containing protein [Sulfuriferula sp.]|nr:SPOR domain-containing protein [Sulfuriferula sp.]
MRLLVLLLLLLNLLTLAWIQWGQPAPQPAPAELNPEKIRIADKSEAPAVTKPVPAPAPTPTTDATAAPAVNIAAKTAGTPTSPAAPAAPPAKLIAETKPAGGTVCVEWGPIAINRVDDAQIRLNRFKLGNRLSAEDASIGGGPYWVYYPPLKTKDDADNMVIDLRNRGIKDVTVVRDGKWQNAISMGLYSKEAIANVRVENLKKQGIIAHVDARGKAARLFKLNGLNTDELSELKKMQADFGGPALRKTTCPLP